MKDTPSQLALRQVRHDLTRPRTLVAQGGAIAVLTLAGPFETIEILNVAERLVFWAAIVLGSYAIGAAVHNYVQALGLPRTRPRGAIFAAAVPTALGVTALVVTINAVALGFLPPPPRLWTYLSTIFAIAAIVSFLISYFSRSDTPETAAAEPPRLLARLPLDKRGPLVALSAEDHYVRIFTTKGEDLVLMRLSDAIAEASPSVGLKVHRSHWIALDQVTAARRTGDTAELTLTGGQTIPVSRAQISAIKDAGLLPQRT